MALLDQFLASLMGAQTPWAQQQMNQMLGQGNMTTQGAPELPVSKGAANAGAPSAGLPATDSQVSRMNLGGPMPGPQSKPVAAPAPAPMPMSAPVSAGTFLTGALRGASQANNPIGMLLGGLGGALGAGEQVDQRRQSYELLIQSGFDPAEAALAIQNPALAQQVAARREKMMALSKDDADTNKNIEYLVRTGKLTKEQAEMLKGATPEMRKQVIAAAFSTKAPDIKTITGPYGQETAVTWDAQSNSWKPVQVGSGGPVAAPMGSPAPMAPAPQMPAPGAAMGAPAMPAPQASAPAPSTDVEIGQPQIEQPQIPPGMSVGPGVPKAPEGYVHRVAPDGSGFLYGANGQPVFESKAEADARAKATEKRATERVDAENQRSGSTAIIDSARGLTKMPGFESALALGRASIDVGIPTPFGFVGGDITSLPKALGRTFDKDNPAWGAVDQISAVQKSLNLIVGKAFLKGQGQVSNFERQMVADAIGDISKASNAADFQFRLNHAQRLVDAAASGDPGAIQKAASQPSRPTNDEITGLIYQGEYGPTFKQDRLDALAKKYNVAPEDMQKYVNELYLRSRGDDGPSLPQRFDQTVDSAIGMPAVRKALGVNAYWESPDPSTQAEPGRTKPLTTEELTQMLKNARRG